MFGQSTQLTMPNYSDYTLWDDYMGNVWFQLFQRIQLSPQGTVMEVAPGATLKISKALSLLHFSGTFYVVEPHPEVSQVVFEKAKVLLPQAKIILIQENFNQVSLNTPIDAIFANHPFDDFITAYGAILLLGEDVLNRLFQDISMESPSTVELLQSTWQQLSESPLQLEEIKCTIQKEWHDFIYRHQPESVLVSQYLSSYFEKNGLDIINVHAQELFKRIKSTVKLRMSQSEIQQVLNTLENYHNPWIGSHLLNAEFWMIYDGQR
ncbi:MAG: hypothetical protein K2X66_17820 [Cyanobacteria bacterium]|nr:hypothetical protein [Cyanobacteriota bacterium]